jgi:uncharacterized membrane protein YgcG
MLTRLGLALIWLLHFLPLKRLAPVGELFGGLLYAFGRERRHVALTNLRLCYPQMPEGRARARWRGRTSAPSAAVSSSGGCSGGRRRRKSAAWCVSRGLSACAPSPAGR